jgi:hypothetical protein
VSKETSKRRKGILQEKKDHKQSCVASQTKHTGWWSKQLEVATAVVTASDSEYIGIHAELTPIQQHQWDETMLRREQDKINPKKPLRRV